MYSIGAILCKELCGLNSLYSYRQGLILSEHRPGRKFFGN